MSLTTGSIGVVVQTISLVGTMKLLGISAEAITSGDMKTMGSPLKTLTDKERKVFQAMVDEFYDRFVEVVAEGRAGLDRDQVRKLADGRVYTGRQALKLGLVDMVVDHDELDEAVDDLLEDIMAGGPNAVRECKALARNQALMSRAEFKEYCVQAIARLRASPEGKEGVGAFLEKREPAWRRSR